MSESKKLTYQEAGFTLIELLIAMVIASIVMAAIGSSYWIQAQTSRDQQMVVAMQQNLRAAMYMLERDIKMAGYDNDRSDPPAATITVASPVQFTFQFIDDTNTQRTVEYSIYDALGDGDFDIGRRVGRDNGTGIVWGQRAAIAENIQTLEFFYTLDDGTQTWTPANPADIRAVGVSIIARTENPTGTLDNRVYRALSGALAGPFNDRFTRQIATATIKCRNMG